MNRQDSGFSLSLVLMCASLALIAAFTLGSITTQHLRLVRERTSTQDALLLADQAIAQSLSQLRLSQSWGHMHTEDLVVSPEAQRQATVSFKRDQSWYSTNNFDGSDGMGWNGPVPPGQAEIVAVATSQGIQRVVDAFVSVPLFPYVLAVDGPLQVDGQLQAIGPPTADPQQTGGDPQFPASVASNAGVTVAGACLVTGDVVCPGPLQLPDNAVVQGVIRSQHVQIPDIPAARWDPRRDPAANLLQTQPGQMLAIPAGHFYSGGDVNVQSLSLDGSLLYVNGDLTVSGGVTGRGTIIVAGRTAIGGAVDVSGSDLVALLGEGDVALDNSTGATRFFQGLVYTQGSFTASNVTVVGCFIAAQRADDPVHGHVMHLDNVTAVYLPAAAQMTAATGLFGGSLVGTVYVPSAGGSVETGGFGDAQPLPAALQGSLTQVEQQNQQTQASLPAGAAFVSTLGQVQWTPAMGPPRPQPPPSAAGLSLINQVAQQMAGDPNFSRFVTRDPSTQQPVGIKLAELDLPGTSTNLEAMSVVYDPGANRFVQLSPPPVFTVVIDMTKGTETFLPPSAFLAAAQAQGLDGAGMLQSLLKTQAVAIQIANGMLANDASQHGAPIDLSLNQFMDNGVPLKVLSWQER